jgi:hypothetical protein
MISTPGFVGIDSGVINRVTLFCRPGNIAKELPTMFVFGPA